MTPNIPDQKKSRKFKLRNKEWQRSTLRGILDTSSLQQSMRDLTEYYRIYNGRIKTSNYLHLWKNIAENKQDNIPARIRNHPILRPAVDKILGEYMQKPLQHQVVVKNPDVKNKRVIEINNRIIDKSLKRIRDLVDYISDKKRDEQRKPSRSELKKELVEDSVSKYARWQEKNWKDKRALTGQKALNFLKLELDVEYILQKVFFDFLVSGYAITRKRAIHDDYIEYDAVNPVNFDFSKDDDKEFIEDAEWAIYRQYVHTSTLRGLFYDEEGADKIIDKLENKYSTYTSAQSSTFIPNQSSPGTRDRAEDQSTTIELLHITWKSLKKEGILRWVDEDAEIQERVVSEEYKPDEDEDVTWVWIEEVWEGYMIDGKYVLGVRPLPEYQQRRDFSNLSDCKLPYNGIAFSDRNADNISFLELGIPYQVLYNIIHYKLELAIAKAKEVVAVFDLNLLPEGWTVEKFMYFMETTNVAFLNWHKEGQGTPSQKVADYLDLSVKVIDQYVGMLNHIRESWNNISGINRQRSGDVGQYEGKGTVQTAIAMSADITQPIFTKFKRFEDREIEGLIDTSKAAWIHGKKTQYILPDGTEEFLEVDGEEYAETNYGFFGRDTQKDQRNKEVILHSISEMISSGQKLSSVLEILDNDSVIEMKDKIKSVEEDQDQMVQQEQELKKQLEEQQRVNQNINKQLDREAEIKKEYIKGDYKESAQRIANSMKELQMTMQQLNQANEEMQQGGGMDDDQIDQRHRQQAQEREKIEKDRSDQASKQRKLDLEKRKHQDNMRLREKDLKIKEDYKGKKY